MEDIHKVFAHVRSWDQDFLKRDAFSVPPPPEVKRRLEANLQYYQANYAVLVSVVFLFAVVLRPLLLFLLVAITAGGFWLWSRPDDFEVRQSGHTLTKRHLLYGFVAISSLLLFFFAGRVLLISFGLCGLVVGGHASCHRAKSASKEDDDGNAGETKEMHSVL